MAGQRVRVAVVGAGPSGLVLALLLGRGGVDCVVLERRDREGVAGPPKAGMIEYRTVRLLEDVGIAPSVLDFPARNARCEFRTPDASTVLDYGELTGGRTHHVLPQHVLVETLCAAVLAEGGRVRFGHAVAAVDPDVDGATVRGSDPDGAPFAVAADVVVGCDGAHIAVATAMSVPPPSAHLHPVRWLSVIGAGEPLVGHTIYGAHPRGLRGTCGAARTGRGTTWRSAGRHRRRLAPDRIRAELTERLGVPGRLDGVTFDGRDVLDLRVRTVATMQHGPLFLAGDAAHLTTPAGGKGMNLAVQDAVELARGLLARYGRDGRDGADSAGRRLAAYSATRLSAVWRTQAFSDWFLRIIQSGRTEHSTDGSGFAQGVTDGWVRALREDRLLATWFAHATSSLTLVGRAHDAAVSDGELASRLRGRRPLRATRPTAPHGGARRPRSPSPRTARSRRWRARTAT